MKEERGMKELFEETHKGENLHVGIDIDLVKFGKRQAENDNEYLKLDRMGMLWFVHEENGVKHCRVATDEDWKEWGIEDRLFWYGDKD